MLNEYKKFLEDFDRIVKKAFELEREDIHCKEGCCLCCEEGDYPFTRLEMEYLMSGFKKLAPEVKKQTQKNLAELKAGTSTKCPFLINCKCCLYEYRAITCRTHGLAYKLGDGSARLPICTENGLNFASKYDKKTQQLNTLVIEQNLELPAIIRSAMAKEYKIEFGEIRALKDWFKKKTNEQ